MLKNTEVGKNILFNYLAWEQKFYLRLKKQEEF